MKRKRQLLEYICWALALLCIMPLATAVGARMFYAGAAEYVAGNPLVN